MLKKMFKKLVAATLVAASVFAFGATSALAATEAETKTVTANVYVTAENNSILHKTAYFSSSALIPLPLVPGSNNATLVDDGTTVIVTIPLTNNVFKFNSFANGVTENALADGGVVSGSVAGTATDSEAGTVATSLTFKASSDTFKYNSEYNFLACNTYAKTNAITGSNAGPQIFTVTMKVEN